MADTAALEIAKRETLVDTIVRALIRFIADNGLRGGDRLPTERELAEMVGVSRLALREALSMLKGLGVLEPRHGKGIFVRPLDISIIFSMLSPLLRTHVDIHVQDLLQMRSHLESSIAELAAVHRADEDVRILEGHLDGMRRSIGDRSTFMEHDMAFHEELARSTGNPIFHIFMAAIADLVLEFQLMFPDKREYREQGIPSHQAILDAVIAQDSAAARAAMIAHIGRAAAWMDEGSQPQTP